MRRSILGLLICILAIGLVGINFGQEAQARSTDKKIVKHASAKKHAAVGKSAKKRSSGKKAVVKTKQKAKHSLAKSKHSKNNRLAKHSKAAIPKNTGLRSIPISMDITGIKRPRYPQHSKSRPCLSCHRPMHRRTSGWPKISRIPTGKCHRKMTSVNGPA